MLHTNYYYFSTHTINQSIYSRLESSHEYTLLEEETQEVIDKFVSTYPRGDYSTSPLDHCSNFVNSHREALSDLIASKGLQNTKYFLSRYIGYQFQWGASTRSFGKTSDKRAEEISEEELIEEMTSPNGTIKKLLDSAHYDLNVVKPFLPAIMISLDTNTRNKTLMEFTHTGRFCFDFDAFLDSPQALFWMDKVWEGTENIKPYMAFLSPRGKGFKIFCRVDKTDAEFINDYSSGDREVVMKHHKVWYEGAKVELLEKFPELKENFDESTKDPQRLTYLPFIDNPSDNFKYDDTKVSSYTEIVSKQKKSEREELMKKISQNSSAVNKIMKDQGIKSMEDAYHLLMKSRQDNFDIELETEKFNKLVDYIEELMSSDNRVSNWVYEKFSDYHTLHKMSWVLYGVFGELAIDNLKRLIPPNSNKLEEGHNDYRWAIRSKDDYEPSQLASLTPGAFYALVCQLGEVRDYVSENFRVSSKNVTDFKLLNGYYETYEKNKSLLEDEDTQSKADLSEFLDEATNYIDKKKIRLPLIEELDELTAEVSLGPKDYLNKDVMTNIYQSKYSDKKIFCLRSQCCKSTP